MSDPSPWPAPDQDDQDAVYENDDCKVLTQAWINERCAPELLPFETQVVANLTEMIEAQTECISAFNDAERTFEDTFANMMLEQELERIKFVIKSYLRTRLRKIQEHTFFILNEAEYSSRLSPKELEFAQRFQALRDHCCEQSFLNTLPRSYQKPEERATAPDMNEAIFCRIREDIGEFQLIDSLETIELRKDDLYILPYQAIRELLRRNLVDLI
ncbi:uncharacterized protein BJ171DRAFT_620932 [Polychytrium aggregatum]|uniref:uncharacterized protein n=1 Tax=Polychytrium aggregatum TaxID=110093 RepID=UPI0022FEFF80|nr:uncharacterized protein BJ171DRAFT_620932 [Polychytrium aggregatum]KAI9209470.1 hypothetical protein BJ171DRAFT_620932 [Polychytrium aggregatum]